MGRRREDCCFLALNDAEAAVGIGVIQYDPRFIRLLDWCIRADKFKRREMIESRKCTLQESPVRGRHIPSNQDRSMGAEAVDMMQGGSQIIRDFLRLKGKEL